MTRKRLMDSGEHGIQTSQHSHDPESIDQLAVKKRPGIKKKKNHTESIDPEIYAFDVIRTMKEIRKKDIELNIEGKPSLTKLENIDSIYSKIIRKDTQDACIRLGVLTEIKTWLEPLPDKGLPNNKIKKILLDLLLHLQISKSDLLESGIGKIVHFYSTNIREDRDIRGGARNLVRKWKELVISEDTMD
jgi:transcription factor SPN1